MPRSGIHAHAEARDRDDIFLRLRRLRLLALCVLLLSLAPARDAAYGQFSAPWDPDFSQQAKPSAPPPEEAAEGRPASAAPAAPEAEAAPVVVIPGAGPFLLLDRPDPKHILEPLAPAAGQGPPSTEGAVVPLRQGTAHEFLDFVDGLKPFAYRPERLTQARTRIEQGLAPSEPSPFLGSEAEELAISTAASLLPPPPELEMPAQQMSLSITGRKIIGFNFSEKRYLHDQSQTGRPASASVWDIQQQMQLRMQGKVGPKITVNVDYDDTKTNQQDISIVYQGDPNEVVQNVSFGDIDLSLPPTEFVSYNKQLFGIRADIKFKGLKASFIASRTKGTSKFREFIGNTQFVAIDLLDTSYVRRQFYDIGFGSISILGIGTSRNRLPIRTGTEQVWLSQMNAGTPNVNQSSFTAHDLAYPNQSTGAVTSDKWTRLSPGADYTIDYVNGIISFRNAMQAEWAIAVDYIDATGQALSNQTLAGTAGADGALKVIKTPSDLFTSTSTETGYNRELKTVYNLGQPQIVRDDGHGNFVLQVLNQQRVEVGSGLNPIQKYPDTINVDFELGNFRLTKPFAVVGDSSTADPNIYSPTPISQRLIHVEYHYRLRTFQLEPSIVAQSETITVDGVKLNRNVDYFIDYDSGFVTFFNPDRIGPNSRVDLSYEVSPLGGISNTSLLGGRVSYDFTKNISLGSTLLYQAGAKSQTVPNITELASSLLVYDFDLKLKDIRLLPKLKASFAGEYSQSRQNPNLNGNALIDNMEGIKQEDMPPLIATSWQIASNPNYSGSVPPDPGSNGSATGGPFNWSWASEGVKLLEINKHAQAGADDIQQVLDVKYDFSHAGSTQEISIVYPFSVSGLDFSQKTVLEVVMLGDNSNNLLNFRLGGVDENADGSGKLNTGNIQDSRTEDVNGNGVLDADEDVGWCYQRPAQGLFAGDPACSRYGAKNGIVDAADLNKNGRLDSDDGNGGDFGYMCAVGQPGGVGCAQSGNNGQLFSLDSGTHTKIDFGSPYSGNANGWQTFQIPLNISTANLTSWQVIKDLRISVRRAPGGAATGMLKFAHIGVVGTTWQKGLAGDPSTAQSRNQSEDLVVVPVNSVDNPNYAPIFNAGGDAAAVYNDLYGSVADQQRQQGTNNLSEQSLQMDFANMTLSAVTGSTTTVFTKRIFTRAVDISQHKQFVFLLYGNVNCDTDQSFCDPGLNTQNPDHQFFLRVGNDTNFWEARVPLSFKGWKKITINQLSSANNGVQDIWKSGTDGVVIVSSGAPSLQQVAQLVAGVRKLADGVGTGLPTKGRVWVDEIYLANAVVRVGDAHSISADFDWTNWATFGFKDRYMDRNFQTPTAVVANQDNRLDSAYVNLKRISFFPMSFNLTRTITVTPNTALTGNLSNLVNNLQNGQVTTWNGTAQGNFARGAWPRLSLSYKRNRTEYESLTRIDDSIDYSGAMQYGVPVNSRFLPKTVDLNYGHRTDLTDYSSLAIRQIVGNPNTRDISQTYGARLTFIPWTGSSLNPSYTLTKVTEHRSDLDSDGVTEHNRQFPKSMNQSAGVASNFRFLSWFNPQVNYQADIIENTILNISTVITNTTYFFDIGDIKTVNRSANGSVSLPINVADIVPKIRLLRSVNIVNGYQLQDGDVWNNVESGYQSNLNLWVRTPLKVHNPAAQLANRTLRDTFNSTQRWSPLSAYDLTGRWAPLKTLSISNNYVRSIQRSEVTGTLSKTLSTTFPDLVASISQVELLVHSERWMSNTQINFRYSAHKTENVGASIATDQSFSTDLRSVIRKRYDTLVSYNRRDSKNLDLFVDANTQKTQHQDATVQVNFNIRKVYLTPKVDYSFDQTTLGTGVKTQDVTVITPSLLTRMDVALPRGLLLPGAKKAILFSNRIIWTTTLSLAHRRSPVAQTDNSDLASLNTSGDYEIAKNLRLTLNGAFSRLWHKYLKQEEYISYSMGTTLTFQF